MGSIVVALAGGGVNSYMIDQAEDFEDANFWTYLKRNWNMVTGTQEHSPFHKHAR